MIERQEHAWVIDEGRFVGHVRLHGFSQPDNGTIGHWGWGYGMSVAVEETPSGAPAGAIGWSGGFGSKWQSDPAAKLTTVLLTQRMFDGPKPAPLFERFEQDGRKTEE